MVVENCLFGLEPVSFLILFLWVPLLLVLKSLLVHFSSIRLVFFAYTLIEVFLAELVVLLLVIFLLLYATLFVFVEEISLLLLDKVRLLLRLLLHLLWRSSNIASLASNLSFLSTILRAIQTKLVLLGLSLLDRIVAAGLRGVAKRLLICATLLGVL